jgi:hypothetical protein
MEFCTHQPTNDMREDAPRHAITTRACSHTANRSIGGTHQRRPCDHHSQLRLTRPSHASTPTNNSPPPPSVRLLRTAHTHIHRHTHTYTGTHTTHNSQYSIPAHTAIPVARSLQTVPVQTRRRRLLPEPSSNVRSLFPRSARPGPRAIAALRSRLRQLARARHCCCTAVRASRCFVGNDTCFISVARQGGIEVVNNEFSFRHNSCVCCCMLFLHVPCRISSCFALAKVARLLYAKVACSRRDGPQSLRVQPEEHGHRLQAPPRRALR